MTTNIITFPNSKRKLSREEEILLTRCANHIHNLYKDRNPFITDEHRLAENKELLSNFVKSIFAANED